MSNSSTHNSDNTPAKPATSNNSTAKPTVARPTSNTNANMEYKDGTPSFTKKSR